MIDFKTLGTGFYQERTPTTEAVQWDGTLEHAGHIIEWVDLLGSGKFVTLVNKPLALALVVDRGRHVTAQAYKGDWVLIGPGGAVSIRTNANFTERFEVAEV